MLCHAPSNATLNSPLVFFMTTLNFTKAKETTTTPTKTKASALLVFLTWTLRNELRLINLQIPRELQ